MRGTHWGWSVGRKGIVKIVVAWSGDQYCHMPCGNFDEMSGSGNGADVAAVYQLLSQVAQTVAQHSRRFDLLESRVEDGFASLRQTVPQYHASVMGHGTLISELDHRVRRIEEHLHLPPIT